MYALIVDNSRAMRRVLRQIIEPLGFIIEEAGHGIEGLHRLTEHSDIELVLVDWNMPGMTGIDFVKAVRSNPLYERMKLVMTTSETEPSKMARALMSGVDEFLMKPFTPDMLLDKLQSVGVSIPCVL